MKKSYQVLKWTAEVREKESGFTYVVADRERCYKYYPVVPDVVPKRSTRRQGELAKV